ncbi:MAG: RsiV family protein [Mesorhizobium sp.]
MKRPKREVWDGLPGYEYEAQLIDLSSSTYRNINDISDYIRANFLKELFTLRKSKIEQDPERHSFAGDRWSRTNTFNASCSDPYIKNRVISIKYTVHWYGAGAAHPNHGASTFCFVMDPLFRIENFGEIFSYESGSLDTIKKLVIADLLERKADDGTSMLDEDWVRTGIEDWNSFSSFIFKENVIELYFPPYQIGPYAGGSFEVEVPYLAIKELMSREYQVALGIEYIR